MTEFHTLALAAPSLADDQLSEPFAVLYTGQFKHGDSTFKVSEKDLDHAVEQFNAQKEQGYEPSIDWEHSFAEGGTSRAAGWIKELWRDGKKLMARAKWTPEARQQIASEEYRFFSPEFSTDAHDEHGKSRGFSLLAGGLTNRPHLKALGAVALSEDVQEKLPPLDSIRAALREEMAALPVGQSFHVTPGPGANANVMWTGANTNGIQFFPSFALPAGVGSGRRKTAHMADENTVTLTEDQHQKLVESASQVEALTEKVEALSEAVEAQKNRADETAKELQTERLTACLSQARREGRIDAKDETTEKWTERAEKLGLDVVKELLAEMPADTIAMSERGHGEDKPVAVEAPEGTDPVAFKAAQRADEIFAEHKDSGMTYEQAASKAYAEVTA